VTTHVDQSEPGGSIGGARTVERMRCVECGREKVPEERGWVTVLSPSGAMRIHYCAECMIELVQRATGVVDHDGAADA
jgi:hypothetical protein